MRYIAVLATAAFAFAQQPPAQPDHMEHRFDQPEQSAKSFDDPNRDGWQMPDRVIAALELKNGSSVADIGSGTGYFTVRLAKSATQPKVFGSDIEPSMVTYLKARAEKEGLRNIFAVRAAADSPNLPAPVDVILIVDTYHHIGSRATYFRALQKSLNPGGRIVIVDFRPDAAEGPPKEFRFSAEQIRQEMAEAGYRLISQPDFLPRQQFLIFEPALKR